MDQPPWLIYVVSKINKINQSHMSYTYICYMYMITLYISIYIGKALSSGNQHYFFTKVKENRSTENGFWKEIGVTKPIVSASEKVGIKKYLVFNLGEAPQGTETSWVMQEYLCSPGFNTSASCASTCGRRKNVSDRLYYIT